MGRFRKIPPVMLFSVFGYIVLVGCLLFVTFPRPVEERLETIKVNISDFQPPRLRELPPEQKKQIAKIEQAAREVREQATNVDLAAEQEKILQQVESFSVAAESVMIPVEITHSRDAIEAENAELLASVEGIGPVDISFKGRGSNSIGPPGLVRGASLKTRLRKSRRRYALKSHGGNDKTEGAVEKALKYLASKQNRDGSWGGRKAFKTGDSVALSSLAILGFLGHGEHYDSQYGKNVSKGITYLLSAAQTKGVERVGSSFGHAILTYALAEAYSVTGDIRIKQILQDRIAAIIRNQNSMGSYSLNYDNSPVTAEPTTEALQEMSEAQRNIAKQIIVGEPECDLSLLGWHVQALTAAKVAGIKADGLDDALKAAASGLIQIHQAKRGGFSQGVNAKRFDADQTLTPVGLLSLQLLGYGQSKVAARSKRVILGNAKNSPAPKWTSDKGDLFPLYRWYYQTQTIFQWTKGKGKLWNFWNNNLKKELISKQQKNGSWSRSVGSDTFRLKNKKDLTIYSTAMGVLMLEVYYRYLPSYSVHEAPKKQESLAERLDAAKLGILKRMEEGIDPEAAMLLGAGIRKIEPIQFGKFNGKPKQPDEPQIKSEFKTYASLASTIGVHKPDELPQLLQPNQRVAFFLDDLLPAGFKWHLQLSMAISFNQKEEYKSYVPLEVVVNGKTIYNAYLHTPHQLVSVLIPADTLNPFGNVLEVRNSGDIPICFDAARLESPQGAGQKLFLAAKDVDKLPQDSQYLFNIGVVDVQIPKGLSLLSKFQLAHAIMIKPEKNSLYERQKALWMLKTNIERLEHLNLGWANLLKENTVRIRRLMVGKIDPLVRLKNINDVESIRPIASAFGPFVKYWQVDAKNANKAKAIINEYCKDAYIITNNGQNGAKIFHQPAFAEYRQPLGSLLKSLNYDPSGVCWGMWDAVGSEEMGKKFQKYYLCKEGRGVIEWISGGGCGVVWDKILEGGKFYDSLYKTPLPALASIRQAGKLFEGAPQRLPSGFYPAVGEKPLLFASSAASLNAPGIATVIVARRFPIQREVEVIAMVPWNGITEVIVETGYLPKDAPALGMAETIKKETDTVEIKNNLFRYRGVWPEMAVLRLVKKGSRDLKHNSPRIQWAKSSVKIDIDKKLATRDEPRPDTTKISARNPEGFASTTGSQCSFKTIPASIPAVKNRANQPLPAEPKSSLITFAFDKGYKESSNNVFLSISSNRGNSDSLCFMVLPRIIQRKRKYSEATRLIRLRFTLGRKILELPLRSNKWNYVTVPMGELADKNWNSIRILSPTRLSGMQAVSYELNNMAYYSDSGICYSETKRKGKAVEIVLLGKPGSNGEYRFAPKKGWRITNIECKGIKDFILPHYMKGANPAKVESGNRNKRYSTRIKKEKEEDIPPSEGIAYINTISGELEVHVKFPEKLSESLTAEFMKKLSGKAKSQMKKNEAVPVIITAIQELNRGR